MIRKVLMSTVALVAISGSALAADLPSRRAPPVYVPPIPVFTWTGFYVGGDIGFGFGKDILHARPSGITSSSQPNGVIGGGHVGYNFSTQSLPILGGLAGAGAGPLGGGLVFGIEGDISGTDYRDNPPILGSANLRNEIQGSARARVGIAVDRALFFATGGAAFAQFQSNYAFTTSYQPFSSTKVGYTVGGGVEYAITTQWSLRAQYLYSDFGSFNNILANGVLVNRHEYMQRAEVGFSYKFDTPVAPVVARY